MPDRTEPKSVFRALLAAGGISTARYAGYQEWCQLAAAQGGVQNAEDMSGYIAASGYTFGQRETYKCLLGCPNRRCT